MLDSLKFKILLSHEWKAQLGDGWTETKHMAC